MQISKYGFERNFVILFLELFIPLSKKRSAFQNFTLFVYRTITAKHCYSVEITTDFVYTHLYTMITLCVCRGTFVIQYR